MGTQTQYSWKLADDKLDLAKFIPNRRLGVMTCVGAEDSDLVLGANSSGSTLELIMTISDNLENYHLRKAMNWRQT